MQFVCVLKTDRMGYPLKLKTTCRKVSTKADINATRLYKRKHSGCVHLKSAEPNINHDHWPTESGVGGGCLPMFAAKVPSWMHLY